MVIQLNILNPVCIPIAANLLLLVALCSMKKNNKDLPKPQKILGIFGGMGPEATVDFYQRVIKSTPAQKDQDHIPTLIYSLPQVPDRTHCIKNQDLSIIPYLIEAVTRLEKAGASFICIPCNTAHYFHDDMKEAVSIPVLHMIRETVYKITTEYPEIKEIGLLATSGTLQSRVYEKEFASNDFSVILPDDQIQTNKIMKAIYGIKAGKDKKTCEDLLTEAGNHVIEKGANLIVLGCTEIPLAFNPKRVSVPVVNATEVLAKAAIRMYYER